jgi:hypothetical protein
MSLEGPANPYETYLCQFSVMLPGAGDPLGLCGGGAYLVCLSVAAGEAD